jgi:hypothetical protein
MSHLASHLGEPGTAVEFAVRGRSALAAPQISPGLHARLLALEARGRAARRDERGITVRLLLQAERTLQLQPAEPASPWVSHYDSGSLATDAGRCLRDLGDLNQARRQAEHVIASRPAHRVRSHAFGQISLAEILVLQGEYEHACSIAADVLAATESLSSYLVIRQLLRLAQALRAYNTDPATAAFLANMDQVLSKRVRQIHQLPSAGRPSITGVGT